MNVRAKFRCIEETRLESTNRRYKFMAVYDTATPENQRFSTATPFGTLEIVVSNPQVSFEVGKEYYLDFSQAGE